MNDLINIQNELIIKKRFDVISTKNKEKYTKLIIKRKIKPVILNEFKNVKELVIDFSSYNEEKLDKLLFKDKIEKLTCKNMSCLGIKYFYHDYGSSKLEYTLPLLNLKVLELDHIGLKDINPLYLKDLENLETIIFNVSENTKLSTSSNYPLLLPQNLKEIVIRTEYSEHSIKFDYIPSNLNDLYFESDGIHINFSNNYINTETIINNNKMNVTNTLICPNDSMIKDDCLYIPDFINDIKITGGGLLPKIESISINPSKLKLDEINEYRRIDKYIKNINKVIIRSDNEMKLNPNVELSSDNYGKLESIYIENKKLYIKFKNCEFIVDDSGNIEKNDIKKIDNKDNEIVLDKDYKELSQFSSKQLEYYTYYKKILELLSLDKEEVKQAMNVIESELIKKLKI